MTTIIPNPPFDSGVNLMALCVWREARGEQYLGKLGVVWTIRNRCAMSPAEGFRNTPDAEILRKWQFTSFNSDDPNSKLYPAVHDSVWADCLRAAESAEPDPTGGAVFYFSPPLKAPPPAWGHVELSAKIGHLNFYRISPKVVT